MQIIYLLYIFSFFPNFVIGSKIRFFQIFGVEIRKDIDWKEVVFIVSVVALALAFFLSNVQLQTMIKIDGAIVVSSLSIIFPVVMHLKCVLADRSSG